MILLNICLLNLEKLLPELGLEKSYPFAVQAM
jgi:hypothetical protein